MSPLFLAGELLRAAALYGSMILVGMNLSRAIAAPMTRFARAVIGAHLGLGTLTLCWFVLVASGLPFTGAFVWGSLLLGVVATWPLRNRPAVTIGGSGLLGMVVTGVIALVFLAVSLCLPIYTSDSVWVYGAQARMLATTGSLYGAYADVPLNEQAVADYPAFHPLLYGAAEIIRFKYPAVVQALFGVFLGTGLWVSIGILRPASEGSVRVASLATLLVLSTPLLFIVGTWVFPTLATSSYLVVGVAALARGLRSTAGETEQVSWLRLSALFLTFATWSRGDALPAVAALVGVATYFAGRVRLRPWFALLVPGCAVYPLFKLLRAMLGGQQRLFMGHSDAAVVLLIVAAGSLCVLVPRVARFLALAAIPAIVVAVAVTGVGPHVRDTVRWLLTLWFIDPLWRPTCWALVLVALIPGVLRSADHVAGFSAAAVLMAWVGLFTVSRALKMPLHQATVWGSDSRQLIYVLPLFALWLGSSRRLARLLESDGGL